MSNGLIWFYGGYEHDPGEVFPRRIEIRPLMSDRGYRWGSKFRFSVGGSFVNESPELDESGVDTKIGTMITEYTHDYKDCGFKLQDGTLTNHVMYNDDPFNLSGNHIIHRSWDNRYPTEFANTRSYSITVEALFQENYSQILSYDEKVTKFGTGGPRWELYETWDGTPVRKNILSRTKVGYVQQGSIVGLSGYPPLPAPYWPQDEQQWKRKVTHRSGKLHGHLSYSRATHYQIDYSYYFEMALGNNSTNFNIWGQ